MIKPKEKTQVIKLTRQHLFHLFIDHNIDLYPPLSSGLQHAIKSIILIPTRRPSQVQLRGQPPIHDPNLTLSLLDSHRKGIEIATAVHKPFDAILGARRSEAVEAVVDGRVQGVAQGAEMRVRMHLPLKFAGQVAGEVLGVFDGVLDVRFRAVEEV